MILRMVRFASSVSVRTESVPLVIRKDVRKPETGKHDHAFGHPGDARDQFRDGRRGCRNTGRDSESGWRIILPPICKAAEQLVASWLWLGRQSFGLAGPPSANAIAKRVRYAVDTLVRAWSARPLSKSR